MTPHNGTRFGTAFTVSIEAASGVTTGISAADRARTIQAAVAPHACAHDIVQPGHIFPVMAQEGGVLMRAGHTEAGCDLTALAGLTPAAVICEIINDDGTMARMPELLAFARQHNLKVGTVADLIQHRSLTESMVERVATRTIHTSHGPFHAILYRDKPCKALHLALVHGAPQPAQEALVRVHAPLSVLDLLETREHLHSWSIDAALGTIASTHCGVLVLLNCDGSGDALCTIFKAFGQPVSPVQTPVDFKTYGIGAQILRDTGVGKMRLLADPYKLGALSGYGLEITGFMPMPQNTHL